LSAPVDARRSSFLFARNTFPIRFPQTLAGYNCLISMLLSAGDKLGPYEILSPIGAGGMGYAGARPFPRLRTVPD